MSNHLESTIIPQSLSHTVTSITTEVRVDGTTRFYTVTNTNDSGSGSLRDEMTQAITFGDVLSIISFSPSRSGQVISLFSVTGGDSRH